MTEDVQSQDSSQGSDSSQPVHASADVEKPAGSITTVASDMPLLSEPKWYIAPGIPGQGDPPEGYDEEIMKQYPTVQDLVKAHMGMRKQLSKKGGFAPEDYEIPYPIEEAEENFLDTNSFMFTSFKDAAKALDLSQEKFNGLVEWWGNASKEANESYQDQMEKHQEAALAEMGPDISERLTSLKEWVSNNLGDKMAQYMDNDMGATWDIQEKVELFEGLKKLATQSQAPVKVEPHQETQLERLERLKKVLTGPGGNRLSQLNSMYGIK